MKSLYFIIILIIAIIAEILLGYYELIFPALAITASYIVCLFGWRKTSIIIFCAAISLDILYGRTFFITPFLLALTIWLSVSWNSNIGVKTVSTRILIGCLISLFYCVPLYLLKIIFVEFKFATLCSSFLVLFISIVFASAINPLIINILDKFTRILGLNSYKLARDNQHRRTLYKRL